MGGAAPSIEKDHIDGAVNDTASDERLEEDKNHSLGETQNEAALDSKSAESTQETSQRKEK